MECQLTSLPPMYKASTAIEAWNNQGEGRRTNTVRCRKMIFATFEETPSLKDLLSVLGNKYGIIEWGNQGTAENPDAYFGVSLDGDRVAIDSLTSIEFQVKYS